MGPITISPSVCATFRHSKLPRAGLVLSLPQFWNPLFVLGALVPLSREQCLEIKARPTRAPATGCYPFWAHGRQTSPNTMGASPLPSCLSVLPHARASGPLQWQWCCAYQSATVTLPLSAVLSETEAFQCLSLFFTSWG